MELPSNTCSPNFSVKKRFHLCFSECTRSNKKIPYLINQDFSTFPSLFHTIWKKPDSSGFYRIHLPSLYHFRLILTDLLSQLVGLINSSLSLIWETSLEQVFVHYRNKQSRSQKLFEPVIPVHFLTFQIRTCHDTLTFSGHTSHRLEVRNVFGYLLKIWKHSVKVHFLLSFQT